MLPDWFNPSLIIATLALWVARENFRRSNHVLIRLRSVSTSTIHCVEQGLYSQFVVEVQNVGVPLHDLAMTLSFSPGCGSAQIGLRTEANQAVRTGQFHKGMITRFVLRTDRFNAGDTNFLRLLHDVDNQHVALNLFADGSLAWVHPFDRLGRGLKRRWNHLAARVNWRCRRRVGTNHEGMPIVRYYNPLPLFTDPSHTLTNFIHGLPSEQDGSGRDGVRVGGGWRV